MGEKRAIDWTYFGAGNMASSLIGGMIGSGTDPHQIAVIDTNAAARESLASRFGIRAAGTLNEVAPREGVVLAVKPNVVTEVCASIEAASEPVPLVVSVAAGVREQTMQQRLPRATPVIRCMPNTPALLGLGATALHANAHCSAAQIAAARNLLENVGKVFVLDSESQLDAITALSGSGPAYVFYLIEHMAAHGESLGLPADMARELAIETAFGAASMARESAESPAQLRRRVTSPGGTTAAAISVFDNAALADTIGDAMQAACRRAVQLGDEHDITR